MLALVLAAVSGVCLVAGWLLEQILLVYIALGLSAAGLLLVVVSMWRRKRITVRESAEGDEPSESASDGAEAAGDIDAATNGEAVSTEEDSVPELDREVHVERSTGQRLDGDATVHVVHGRKRFHVGDCRLVRGKQVQELTLVEAYEEDFTACSVCVEAGAGELLTEQR